MPAGGELSGSLLFRSEFGDGTMCGMDTTQSVSNSPGSTSSGFLERLKQQDPQAWQQLANVYGPLVYFWCRKYGVKS